MYLCFLFSWSYKFFLGTILDLSDNNLKSLENKIPDSVKQLNLSHNQLSVIDVKMLPADLGRLDS